MSWLRRSGVRLVQAWNRTGSTSGGEAARIWRTVPSRSLPATACAHNTTLFCEQPVPVSAFFTAARSVPRDGDFSHRKCRTVHARSLSSPSSSDPLDVFDIVDLNTKRCMSNDLCENENCWRCLSRSFAIHDRAKSWSKQNTLRPRQVKLRSSETFLFTCDVCGGDCSMRPRSIRADTVVMCKKCRAGPQIFLEDVWSTRNSKRMSDVEQREKCWLFCSDCQHHFVGRKSKTYRPLRPGETKLAKKAWSCPYCKPNDSRISCTDSACKFCREHDTRRIQPPEAFAEIYAAFNVRPLSDRMLYLRTQTTSRNEKYWLGFQKCPHLLEEGGYCRSPRALILDHWSTRTLDMCAKCRATYAQRKAQVTRKKQGAKYAYSKAIAEQERMLDSLSKVRGDQLEGDILKFPIKPARKDDTDTPARDSGEKEKRDTDE